MYEREAAGQFGILKSTINRKRNNKNSLTVGRQCVLGTQEEHNLVEGLIIASKWGFSLTVYILSSHCPTHLRL